MRRLMLRERAPFLMVGDLSADQPLWQDLKRAGFREHSQWTDFSLQVDWASSSEYMASLPRDHRRKLGRVERQAERQGIWIERLQNVEQHESRLRALVAEVLEHHGTHDAYVADLLSRASTILADDLHVVAALQAGEVIGCTILLQDRDAMIAKWIGLDYARTWGTATYRRLVLECVRLAIELGVRRLGLGPTAGQVKREFGAFEHERRSAITVIGRVPTSLVGALARVVAGRAAVDPTFSSARRL
jgi:predicted N-acyltransferase